MSTTISPFPCSPQAAQTDDSLKTAAVLVSVTVEDVNDNVPEFDKTFYSVTLLENSPVDTVVFKAIVTDLDQVDFKFKTTLRN